MKTIFLRMLDAEDKEHSLLGAIEGANELPTSRRFEVESDCFASVPGSPFAYWVSDRIRRRFTDLKPFEAEGRVARQGLATSNDFRFVRAWWAVSSTTVGDKWLPFTKGGKFARYYADIALMVRWGLDGCEVKAFAETTPGTTHWSRNIRNTDFYLRPGLTWPLRGVRFSAQAVPVGCVFSIAGKMAFVAEPDLLCWLALFNCEAFDSFIALFAGKVGGVQYEVGLIQSLPAPTVTPTDQATVASLSHRAWSLRRALDTRTENSHAFSLPALLQVPSTTLAARAAAWADRV
ncbi:MAG TPA: hypothetical protein PLI95_30025, partial [Polyangiaceae bacterium]|nr:hypothetical protein [Polyangiaceae bacterium]